MGKALTPFLLDAIYRMNAGKLKMPANQRYPIDRAAVEEWCVALEASYAPKIVIDFARAFQSIMMNISFDEFYKSLTRSATRLAEKCQEGDINIVVLVLTNTRKSNFWVTMMIWPFIRKHVTQVVRAQYEVNWSAIRPGKTFYLFADDAAYTGSQAVDLLTLHRAPVDADIKVCIVIPFMTKQAKNYITRSVLNPLIFFHSRTQLPSLIDFFSEEEISEIALYPGFVHLTPFQSPVYFDHKMPDTLSCTNWLFALGPVYLDRKIRDASGMNWLVTFGPGRENDKQFQTKSFITGCSADDVPFTNNVTKASPSYEQTVADYLMRGKPRIREIAMCPPRFSATIEYDLPYDLIEDERWRTDT
jgi:hypothetical protein